ncbi:MAG: aldehyde dehydrogenase family protein, partial [Caldilinea sp.]
MIPSTKVAPEKWRVPDYNERQGYGQFFVALAMLKLFEEAGLPKGVINFVPGSGGQVGTPAFTNPNLAGVHFTGSTEVFQNMWKTISENLKNMKYYPRIVGETGGKDFIFVHNT